MANPYFNALQIKHAYAVTCHKAQGGQWDNVFIDPGKVADEHLGEDFYRWYYTAITRAKKQVVIIG
jgi:exodeoxyribonuclease-5